jgi:tetratricopeptide (TPR) repeat protein
MLDQLVLLLAGFVLTTVLGGGLGYLFQRRSWAHQHETVRAEQERQQAIKVFEEVSSLLDKRPYRMRRLYWAAKKVAREHGDAALAARLGDYDETLELWNDNLNRNLALVHAYFGRGARRRLEIELYEEYAAIGGALEEFVRVVSDATEGAPIPPLGRRLSRLGHRVYLFNLCMLELLRTGQLGDRAPSVSSTHASEIDELPVLQRGDSGAAVRRLQDGLRRAAILEGRTDGQFGRETEQAVRALQAEHGLAVDGIVGDDTWAALLQEPIAASRPDNPKSPGEL